MGKIEFTSENKGKSFDDYPRLYLEYGERARIVCIEPAPEGRFVHVLRAPAIVNGEPVMENVKQKDGTVTQRVKMDFIGRHLCLGNEDKVAQSNGKGDPENCPTCAESQKNDAVAGPTRRMAMHVVKYKIQPGVFKPQEPFQAELVAWAFGAKGFTQLVDIIGEHGDLRKKDLLLGPCENKGFQKVDIQVGGSAAWLQSDETKKFVTALYQQNKSEDLQPLIGRKLTREQINEDIQKVLMRTAIANGGSAHDGPDGTDVGGAAPGLDLDSMLGGPSTTAETPQASETPGSSGAEPTGLDLTGLDAPSTSAPTTEEPAVTGSEEKTGAGDPLDFDALLEGL
jgi:hypothetical protein